MDIQLMNIGGKIKSEINIFATLNLITDLGKDHGWMLNHRVNNCQGTGRNLSLDLASSPQIRSHNLGRSLDKGEDQSQGGLQVVLLGYLNKTR